MTGEEELAEYTARIADVDGDGQIDDFSHDTSNLTGFRKMQVRIWLTFEDSNYSTLAKVVQLSIILLIIMSTVLMLVQSFAYCRYDDSTYVYLEAYPRVCDKRPSAADEPLVYFILETIAIVVFTVEYALRLIASPATIGLSKFLNPLAAPMNTIDLVAIIPYYVELGPRIEAMTGGGGGDEDSTDVSTQFLRVVRLIRIARVFKVTKSLHGFQVLLVTIAKSMVPLVMLVVFVAVLCFLFASLSSTVELGDFERRYPQFDPLGFWYTVNDEATAFESMTAGWYWCVQTLTSVGYGEISPLTPIGKVIGTCAALGGVIVLALPITIIGANFDQEFEKSRRWETFQKKSRVAKCRRDQAHTNLSNHADANADPHAKDQAYNVQADLSELLSDHFEQMRDKVDSLLERHNEHLWEKLRADVEDDIDRIRNARTAKQRISYASPSAPRDATQRDSGSYASTPVGYAPSAPTPG